MSLDLKRKRSKPSEWWEAAPSAVGTSSKDLRTGSEQQPKHFKRSKGQRSTDTIGDRDAERRSSDKRTNGHGKKVAGPKHRKSSRADPDNGKWQGSKRDARRKSYQVASERPKLFNGKSISTVADLRNKPTTSSQDVERDVLDEPDSYDEVDEPSLLGDSRRKLMYPHMRPVTRKVSMQTIEKTWSPLTTGCISQISTLIDSLHRPVLSNVNNEKQKLHATTAIEAITRKIVNKLSRGMPFPSSTGNRKDEDEFDFEKTLDHKQSLAAQLTPLLHSNALLETEITRQKALLRQEEEQLALLDANAKDSSVAIRKKQRKQHAFLQSDPTIDPIQRAQNIGLRDSASKPELLCEIDADPDLADAVHMIHGHIESIQNNAVQIDGVLEAIHKTRAAIQADLFANVDISTYEDVVLG